jgi:hypothetical protein
MQRLRQREWNAAKTDAKGVTSGVKTGAKDVRIDVRRGAVAEASRRAPAPVPAQSSSIRPAQVSHVL